MLTVLIEIYSIFSLLANTVVYTGDHDAREKLIKFDFDKDNQFSTVMLPYYTIGRMICKLLSN
jgi:hypothetical protein